MRSGTFLTSLCISAVVASYLFFENAQARDDFNYGLIEAPVPAPALDTDTILTRIAFGSCNDEEKPQPFWNVIAADNPQLFLYAGDNIYGDIMKGERLGSPTPEQLAYSWNILGSNPDFRAFYSSVPMMVAWDDHDYGKNDAGREFEGKTFARKQMLDFFSMEESSVGKDGDGVYYSKVFGQDGKRVQIIMLDTRSFRGPLKVTDEWGAPGKQRYVPSDAEDQQMLGEHQWAWLEAELQKDADLRIVVSSIQLIADTHGWEAWRTLPAERERFFDLLGGARDGRAIVISGDRHVGGIYRDADRAAYPLYEITSSSLNLSFNPEKVVSAEMDDNLVGRLFGPENYGLLDIDWKSELLTMSLKDFSGVTVRSVTIPFGEISAGEISPGR